MTGPVICWNFMVKLSHAWRVSSSMSAENSRRRTRFMKRKID
jgi:hypothetical protein